MGEAVSNLFGGGNKSAKIAAEQSAANQRRSLAQMAAQQAEADQAASTPGGRRFGSKLLTYLGADGQATLG
uniref:hypothetical protein n=1 Tax=Stappia sp. TaxID=1870903 RepID=UPI003BAA7005